MPGPVAVTGATGFIGSALLRALAGRNWSISALTRHPLKPPNGIRWIQGDLENTGALARLVDEAGVIVHCAGRVRGRSAAEFDRTNVAGTANLLTAIGSRHPAPRLLLISSLAARHPDISWYAASKHRAEQIVSGHSGDMTSTIFRPTAVYGPGDREIRPLLNAMQRGYLPVVGNPERRFSLLHIDDLVDAILCWLSAPADVRGTYELDDGTPGGYDWRILKSTAEAAWGRHIQVIPVPYALMHGVSSVNLWLSRLSGRSPMLTPGKVRELTHAEWVCDNGPAYTALGWQPRIRLADALRDDARLRKGKD